MTLGENDIITPSLAKEIKNPSLRKCAVLWEEINETIRIRTVSVLEQTCNDNHT